MRNFLLIFFCFPGLIAGQSLYDPQQFYDSPGGLFDEDSIRDIYLDFYNSNYHNYLESAWYYNPDERIPATLSLNGIIYDSVGVRYKGNSTFCLPNDNNNPKVPYNIDMNYFIGGQRLLDYKKIKLANAWMDPTFLKDITASNIYRKYLPSGEANLMKLHVQGNYLGLYVNTESINKQFLKKHFDENTGPLFKCDNIDRFCDTNNAPSAMPPNLYYMGDDSTLYYNSYDIKSDHGWAELIYFLRVLDSDFDHIDSVLNVDRTLWAFAVNQVVSNLDCYNTYYVHNYYLYQTKDGLFQMIPWDLDNSFVGAIMGWDYWSPSNVYEYDAYFEGPLLGSSQPWEVRPLLYKLLNDPFYRDQYTAHLRTIINESLDTAIIRSGINYLQDLAYDAANNDQHKEFSISEYYSNVESALWTGWGFGGIMSTIDARKEYLLSHPEISLTPPTLYGVNVSNNIVTINAVNATNVELMSTISEYNSKFQSSLMFDDGTNGDIFANDGIYTCILPYNGNLDVKFYVRAQNNDAMIFDPERAEYEFYVYSTISGLTTPIQTTNKQLINITDLLGRSITNSKSLTNIPLIYIYNDGTVEKKLIIK